jgi:hypothetical protein
MVLYFTIDKLDWASRILSEGLYRGKFLIGYRYIVDIPSDYKGYVFRAKGNFKSYVAECGLWNTLEYIPPDNIELVES